MKFSNKYKDYTKASEYFNDQNINEDIKNLEKQKKYIVWVQEFSKKIVVAIFVLYIISILFMLYMMYVGYMNGDAIGIDTFISEINVTFREVVGGYIVKSAIENAFKIAGNYFIGICDARIRALNKNFKNKDNEEEKVEENPEEEPDEIDP